MEPGCRTSENDFESNPDTDKSSAMRPTLTMYHPLKHFAMSFGQGVRPKVSLKRPRIHPTTLTIKDDGKHVTFKSDISSICDALK